MSESIKTIISNGYISFMICKEGGYTCCVLPRYDAYLFSQAIKESVKEEGSVNFETDIMSIDILNMKDAFIIDCTNKFTSFGFQLTCANGKEIGEEIEQAALKGVESFGKPTSKPCKWAYFNAIQD